MEPSNARTNFFCSRPRRLGSLPVFVLLLLVKTLLDLSFRCFDNIGRATVHSLLYFLLPVIFLFILGLLLRPRRSQGLVSNRCCSFRYFLYVTGQAGKAPLIWILLSMIDLHYLRCFAGSDRRWNFQFYVIEPLHITVQILGLVGLALLFILDYGVSQSTCAQKYFSYCFQKWNEDLVLQEVEVVLQQKAEERRKALVADMIQSDLGQLKPEDLWNRGAVSGLVWKYKAIVQKKCAETAEDGQELNEAQNVIEA